MKITNIRTVLMMTTSMYNFENVWDLFLKLNGFAEKSLKNETT
jgi:hypothetical protein